MINLFRIIPLAPREDRCWIDGGFRAIETLFGTVIEEIPRILDLRVPEVPPWYREIKSF